MVSLKYCILGVEGPHDQAFIGKLLKQQRLREFDGQRNSVAIYQGEGSNLFRNLKGRIGEHDPYVKDIHAFGLVLDADTLTPQQKATEYVTELREVALLGEFLKDLLELPES